VEVSPFLFAMSIQTYGVIIDFFKTVTAGRFKAKFSGTRKAEKL
jgi:hypothetical protein